MLRPWHLNRIRRSTGSGRNMAGRFRNGTTSRSRAGWRRRSANWKASAWRLSHPLVGAYRLAAQLAHDRQIWFKRLATPPAAYAESPCCRAPFLPLLTRDVRESGLICQHCNETLVPFEEIPAELRAELEVVGATIRTRPCRRALGRPPAPARGELRRRLRKRRATGRANARARRTRPRAEAVAFLRRRRLGRPGRMPRSPAGRRGGVIYDLFRRSARKLLHNQYNRKS